MTLSKLKEKFARQGRLRGVDRVDSGSPVRLDIKCDDIVGVRTVDAIMAIVCRHVSGLEANRMIEAAIDGQLVVVDVPVVENIDSLIEELRVAGFASQIAAEAKI